MNILKSPYLNQEIPEINGELYKESLISRQMSSPFLTDVTFNDEDDQEVFEEDFEVIEDSYMYEENKDEEWVANYKDEFYDESHEEETSYDFIEEDYDESELEQAESTFNENECTCDDNNYEHEFDTSGEEILDELEDEYYNETGYDVYNDQDEIAEDIDNEFYHYKNVDENIDEILNEEEYEEEYEDQYEEAYEEEIINEGEINRGIINEDLRELEEAFTFGIDTLTTTWQKIKNSSISSKSLEQKSPNGKTLKLPIVSTLLLDSGDYTKTYKFTPRFYGIPETISALQWIGKEWTKQNSKVVFAVRDISQLGGGKVSGHASHRMGIDVDVKLIIDNIPIQAGVNHYKRDHRDFVRKFIQIAISNPHLPILVIGFMDDLLNKEFGRLVRPWPGHASHLHLRFCMPEHRKSELNLRKVYTKNESAPNYKCEKSDKNTSTTKPQGYNIQNAINYNKKNMHVVGWASYKKLIQIKLGLIIFSQDDIEFVKALATWQKKNGFKGDGKLGPQTWSKMKIEFGFISKNSTKPSTNNTAGEDFFTIPNDLGILQIDTSIPELTNSIPSYKFTKEDALWLARFVTGEAGVKNDANGHAVIWAMFNRYGMLRHRVKSWRSFHRFLRLYSTTLQPILSSKGAAQRVWKNHKRNPGKYPIVQGVGNYKDTDIKKVQYQKHIELQKKDWTEIHPVIRTMVVNILRGDISNPGIGIATEFASTRIYFRQKYGRNPRTEEEWQKYTLSYANNRCKRDIKGCTWIGKKTNLNQMKNAFFVDNRFKSVPPSAVNIFYSS